MIVARSNKKRIYFDYASTTPVDHRVFEFMRDYFSEKFGNPGSLHSFGAEAIAAVDFARETIAKAINVDFREIIFTGSATEANNLALRGVVGAARQFLLGTGGSFAPAANDRLRSRYLNPIASGDQASNTCESCQAKTAEPPFRVIISSIEHESVLETAKDLEKEGVEVVYLPVSKEGFVDLKKLKESLNDKTVLVSIMYANNEIGTIQPIKEISREIKDFNDRILFHVDAVQAFQFLDCDVKKLGVDLMTLSAHKIYGPKGVGALYTNERSKKLLKQTITGGGQEFGMRSGTENVSAIAGFGKAVELISNSRATPISSGQELETKRIVGLRNSFLEGLKKIYPKAEVNGQVSSVNYLPNILNIYFPDHLASDLLIKLDMAGVAVSSGSACSARSSKPSHVLKSIGLSNERILRSLRFSFGKPTKKEEVDEFLRRIKIFL